MCRLVQFHGACVKPDRMIVFGLEYMDRGSLESVVNIDTTIITTINNTTAAITTTTTINTTNITTIIATTSRLYKY